MIEQPEIEEFARLSDTLRLCKCPTIECEHYEEYKMAESELDNLGLLPRAQRFVEAKRRAELQAFAINKLL